MSFKTILQRVRRSALGRRDRVVGWRRDRVAKLGVWQVPGHFYSPIPPHPDNVDNGAFDTRDRDIPGIALRRDEQVAILNELKLHYPVEPFPTTSSAARRYYTANDQFPAGDAATYEMILRHLKPRTIIEVGSGFSTALALDVNESYPGTFRALLCIEPYPDRLDRLRRPGDPLEVRRENLQDVELDVFTTLESGDILFIDSTHVAKLASDVNYLLAEVLPALEPGVYVHVHDIHWPFEYPRSWAEEGRAWNEIYMLRSFLQFNSHFEIVLWADFLRASRPELIADFPYCASDPGSGIWLRRTPLGGPLGVNR